MKKRNLNNAGWGLKTLFVLTFGTLLTSCTIYKEGAKIDRTTVQDVKSFQSVTESEIREIVFNNHANEYGHKDLHINGQLYTKSVVNGKILIKACAGCIVELRAPSDSSLRVNMTTEKDGFFAFHGQAIAYSLFLNNKGFNRMELGNISFESGGITTIKLISAAGNGMDRFLVKKDGVNYAWSKIQ